MDDDVYLIDMKLPGLNEYTKVNRYNKYAANKVKQDTQSDIAFFLRNMPVYTKPIIIHFLWVEENARRDLDNISFAKKYILDVMVELKKIKGDGQRYVKGFTDRFKVDKNGRTRVYVKIEEVKEGGAK